jgi:hypothetical protein
MSDTVYRVVGVSGGFAIEYEDAGTGPRTTIGFRSAAEAEAWIAERKRERGSLIGQGGEAKRDKT